MQDPHEVDHQLHQHGDLRLSISASERACSSSHTAQLTVRFPTMKFFRPYESDNRPMAGHTTNSASDPSVPVSPNKDAVFCIDALTNESCVTPLSQKIAT